MLSGSRTLCRGLEVHSNEKKLYTMKIFKNWYSELATCLPISDQHNIFEQIVRGLWKNE